MQDLQHVAAEEEKILGRLADSHKIWRASRPAPHQTPKNTTPNIASWNRADQTKHDFEVIRKAQEDPLGVAIGFQLNNIGWRLYAKGGVSLLTSTFKNVERDQHPGFGAAVQAAWTNLGFPGDPKGIWDVSMLL